VQERRVRSLADAVALLTAARAAQQVAVLWARSDEEGGLWLLAVLDAARQRVEDVAAMPALACGDRAGDAAAALRAGIRRLEFQGSDEMAAKLVELGADLAACPPELPDASGVPEPAPDRGG
jgi:hypothetical protein